jgi:RimJ/RimL family protein N-acetyltransferase
MPERNAWRGTLVRLRAVEPEDWERYARDAAEDSEGQRFGYFIHFPQSNERARERTRELAALDLDQAERVPLAIEDLATGELVGQVTAHGISRRNGTFEYGVSIFPEHRGKGFASEAIILLCRYFFDELRFQKVNATVYAFNEASIAMQRKLGFVEEGCIRRNLYTGGAYHDEYLFGMTAEEFRGRYPSP